MSEQFDVVVIGGGPSGVTAALRARELGATVALAERARMGGICTNDGCAPTRVLAHAARLVRDARQFAEYGLVGESPAVDFARVIDRAQRMVYRLHEKKQLVHHLKQAGVRVIENVGDVQFTDPHALGCVNGEEVRGDKFIICAGGHARRFSFPGSEYTLTHSDVWPLRQLPQSVVIVGGAATGCQLASIFAAFGAHVSLLEAHTRILGAEDASVAEAIHESFQRRGIEVMTGISIKRVTPVQKELLFEYDLDSQTRSVTAEAVVLAVGWVSNADTLNLAAAGVEKNERGFIAVDDYQQTTAPHIWAAGDITGRMMLVQSASYEGRIAAENAVLGPVQRYKHLIVPHGGFTDPEYASVGLTEAQAREEHDIAVAIVPYAQVDRAVIDGHTEGFCKLIVSRETHRVLGAHVVGEQAVEMIQLVAAGMAADMWVEQLAELEIAYPTYAAAAGLAARQIVAELGVMPLAPQWRALGKLQNAEWETVDG